MRRTVTTWAIVCMAFLFFVAESEAQRGMRWRGSGGWSPQGPYGRLYDPSTVEALEGEVLSIDRMIPMKGMSHGVQMMVKTGTGTIPVHLGPLWFLEKQDLQIEPKDKIEVIGSRITFEGKPILIAAEVRKGDQVLLLRDDDGVPVWSGWRTQ